MRNAAAMTATTTVAETPATGTMDDSQALLFQRVGRVARSLHESLRELSYDRRLACAVRTMPDARKRLGHIASLTGRSAVIVLEGVERAQVLQKALQSEAESLRPRWQSLCDGTLAADDFRALATDTQHFLDATPVATAATREHLHAMMMAQDFHDLTGQTIMKIVDIAHAVEASLVSLLLEARPGADVAFPVEAPSEAGDEPQMTSQAQVDELLHSLGF